MELVHVEELCRKIYGANSSPLERFEAHRALLFLQVSASYIDQCRYILERSTEATALMYAAQSLIVVMRKDWGNISPTARISLRDFLLEFLRRLADSRHYLTKKLVQVLCELTRRAWCEDNRHHTIIEHCVTFMQSSNTADLGLRIMADLVAEFDQGRAALFDEPTRRASQAFREQELGLVKAFNVSLDAVWAARSARNLPLLCESLRCLLACLSFDFASTGSDESVPGVSCVYLPKPWVPRVASENAINNFFALYTEECQSKVSPMNEEAASLTLQCLVMVSGTRKNCHDTLSRAGFLRSLMSGMEVMIRTRMGFDQSEECAHHACRLIARFKVTTQLSELAIEPIFPKWFSALRDFTCDCLHSFMTISPRSISYLLEFWSGMISSWTSASSSQMSSASDTDPYNISENLAPIVVAYLTSRSNMCDAAASDNDAITKQSLAVAREAGLRVEASGAACDIDEIDPLASEDSLLDEIGYVILLARMRYTSFQDVIGSILFSTTPDFILSQSHSVTYPGQQARLAFAMYFVGALIGGSFNRGESTKHLDELNVDLATKAFRLSRTRAQVAKSEMKARRGRRIQGIRSFLTTQSLLSQPKSVPPSPNNNNYPLPSSYGSDPSQVIPISQPGSANDDLYVHRTVEMFPRPIRSFDFGLGSDDAEEIRAEMDEDDYDEVPPLLSDPMRRRQRYSADLDAQVIVDEFDAIESHFAGEVLRATAIQRTIAESMGIQGGDRALLDIAVRHIFSILVLASTDVDTSKSNISALIERALGVLRKLAKGTSVVQAGLQSAPRIVSSGLLLLESDFIQQLLKNPSPDRFNLLCEPKQGRSRSFYMATMTSLFFLQMDLNASNMAVNALSASMNETISGQIRFVLSPSERGEDVFSEFMKTFTEKYDALFRTDLRQAKSSIIAVLRDLRGISSAIEDARQYDLLFAWFFPNRIRILRNVSKTFWHDSEVAVPLLKLVSELVCNRGSRISFPIASGGGQVLLVETCRILLDYCLLQVERNKEIRSNDNSNLERAQQTRVEGQSKETLSMAALQAIVDELSRDSKENNEAGQSCPIRLNAGALGMGFTINQSSVELKCMRIVANAITNMVSGRFANIAIFQVFGDDTMQNLKKAVLHLGLASTPEHLGSFTKAENGFVLFAHNVADTSPLDLIQLPTDAFARLICVLAQTIAKGSSVASTPAAFTIETLATMRCRALLYSQFTERSETISGALLLRYSGFINSDLGASHRFRVRVCEETELRAAAIAFAAHDSQQPYLFGDLLSLLLDRVLTAPDGDITNLYALARPITSLACASPEAFRTFVQNFVNAQALARQRQTAEHLDPILRLLGSGTSKEFVADCLRRQEEYTKELCKFIRRFRDFYWAL